MKHKLGLILVCLILINLSFVSAVDYSSPFVSEGDEKQDEEKPFCAGGYTFKFEDGAIGCTWDYETYCQNVGGCNNGIISDSFEVSNFVGEDNIVVSTNSYRDIDDDVASSENLECINQTTFSILLIEFNETKNKLAIALAEIESLKEILNYTTNSERTLLSGEVISEENSYDNSMEEDNIDKYKGILGFFRRIFNWNKNSN